MCRLVASYVLFFGILSYNSGRSSVPCLLLLYTNLSDQYLQRYWKSMVLLKLIVFNNISCMFSINLIDFIMCVKVRQKAVVLIIIFGQDVCCCNFGTCLLEPRVQVVTPMGTSVSPKVFCIMARSVI